MNKNRIQVKDLISVSIYTVMYYIMVAISNVVLFIIPGYSYGFIPIVAALLSGTVFMLMVAKIPKFGAITIMGTVLGINFFLMGRFPGSLIFSFVVALIADIFAYLFKYKSKKALLGSYVIFSYGLVGPALPMFLFPNMYVNHLVEQGHDAAYIENAFSSISQSTFFIIIFGVLVAAIIGGLFGQRMIKKHFEKAGIV